MSNAKLAGNISVPKSTSPFKTYAPKRCKREGVVLRCKLRQCLLKTVRGPFKGHNQAYIDGNPGMVTISRSPKGTVMIRIWTANDTFGPSIDSGAPYEEETALVMWLANGKDSWLEVNYRNADGRLITKRVPGTIGGKNMDDFHSGGSHTNYTSAIGIAKGVPTAAQTNAIRNWAAPFIPAPDPVEAAVAEPG